MVPENGTSISNHVVTFGWYSVEDAYEYLLQVDNNIDFSNPEIEIYARTAVFTSDSLLDGTYYWRVKAYKSTTEASWLWEGIAQFKVFTPVGITTVKDLGVPHLQQHKDTRMLCLDGCAQIGKHAWDVDHGSWDPSDPNDYCAHCRNYCVRACIAMINGYRGGDISQDSISFYILGGGDPEGDLGHGRGLYPIETTNGLSWALYGVSIDNPSGRPTFAQIKAWIDANRPILRRDVGPGSWHATVIDGYEENGDQILHIIDPWTGAENKPKYNEVQIYEVWVPPAGATGRLDYPEVYFDVDNDGIVDFDEMYRFGTDPFNADSDGDGFSDKFEVTYYKFLNCFMHDPDPDGDGWRMENDTDENPRTVVGGVVVPVDKFGLLAPYIGLASTIAIASVASVVYFKRRKKNQ
jgi:hypothetical protein